MITSVGHHFTLEQSHYSGVPPFSNFFWSQNWREVKHVRKKTREGSIGIRLGKERVFSYYSSAHKVYKDCPRKSY